MSLLYIKIFLFIEHLHIIFGFYLNFEEEDHLILSFFFTFIHFIYKIVILCMKILV